MLKITDDPKQLFDALWELATTIAEDGMLCWCPFEIGEGPGSDHEHTSRCLNVRHIIYKEDRPTK